MSFYENDKLETTDINRDEFRIKEKRIKALLKIVEEELDPKLRKKRRWNGAKSGELQTDDDPLCWDEVIDVRKLDAGNGSDFHLKVPSRRCASSCDHDCSQSSEIYELSSIPGFYLIKNALCLSQQLYWAKIALEDYSRAEHTNLTNLAKQKLISADLSASERQSIESSFEIDIWRNAVAENNNFQNFKKLRWSCLGYHYGITQFPCISQFFIFYLFLYQIDWTERKYQKNLKSLIPNNFSTLCSYVAESVGLSLKPEAMIVNYYPLLSSMGGHLDDAEQNLEKPIVSFSIGRSAIFLIGGLTKSIEPKAILLSSGDAIIMSGTSRLCYHGVPCIIPSHVDQFLTSRNDALTQCLLTGDFDPEYENILKYLSENRINLNARQVKLYDDRWIEKSGTGHVKM